MIDLAPNQLAYVVAMLQRLFPHEEVWAFGSRIRGTAKPSFQAILQQEHIVIKPGGMAQGREQAPMETAENSER